MPSKKDNLPVEARQDTADGTITYAPEVIAIISGIAANEVEGVAGMCTFGGIGDIIGKNRNVTRGVKVEVGTEEVSIDLYAIVEYGQPIQRVATEVQENVRKSVEAMTGLHVVRVDVHVQGVSFEKEKREVQKLTANQVPSLEAPAKEKGRKGKADKVDRAEPQVIEQVLVDDAPAEIAQEETAEAKPEAVVEVEEPASEQRPPKPGKKIRKS